MTYLLSEELFVSDNAIFPAVTITDQAVKEALLGGIQDAFNAVNTELSDQSLPLRFDPYNQNDPLPQDNFMTVRGGGPGWSGDPNLLPADKPGGTRITETSTGNNVSFAHMFVQTTNTQMFDYSNSPATLQEYRDAIKAVVLHEIHHTLGLEDEPYDLTKMCGGQTAGKTVMNGLCGKNNRPLPNQAPHMPTTPTPCDAATIRAVGRTTPEIGGLCGTCANGGGGGGGNGGGGGGQCGLNIYDDCDGDGWQRWQDCDDDDSFVHPYDNEDPSEHQEKCDLWAAFYYQGDDLDCNGVGEENDCPVVTVRIRTPALKWLGGIPTLINFRSWNGQWLCPENGGGGEVLAIQNFPIGCAQLVLMDLDGGQLLSGDVVSIFTGSGFAFNARNGGGADLDAIPAWSLQHEWFTIIDLDNPADGVVRSEHHIALQSFGGYYVCAEGGGGAEVNVNRTAIGPWETFQISIAHSTQQTPADWTGAWSYNGDCWITPITQWESPWVIVTNEVGEWSYALITDEKHIVAVSWGIPPRHSVRGQDRD